jgi:Family of unknown function (DUF6212)
MSGAEKTSDRLGMCESLPANDLKSSRPRVFMAPDEMARSYSGAPLLLVSTKLRAETKRSMADWGLPILHADVRAGGETYLFRSERGNAQQEAREIPQLPADILAIVAPQTDAAHLCRLWDGTAAPPVFVADTFEGAIGRLFEHLSADIERAAVRAAELQRALITTRLEYEDTRVTMNAMTRTLSHQLAVPLRLVAAATPSADGASIALAKSRPHRRTIAVVAEGVTSIALHIADVPQAGAAALEVALLGAESSRVLAEWNVPGDALRPGWTVLDLPLPIGPIRETLQLQLSSRGEADAPLRLSLSDELADDEGHVAIKIWVSAPGGRFTQAEHWVWNRVGQALFPPGTALSLPSGKLDDAKARGDIAVARAAGGRTVLTGTIRGGRADVEVADVSLRGIGAIRVELGLGSGDLQDTRFQLVVRAGERALASGWRTFRASESVTTIGVSLPQGFADTADIHLAIADAHRQGAEFASFELRRLDLLVGERTEAEPGLEAIPQDLAPPQGGTARPNGPSFAGLKLHGHEATDAFELFDISVLGLESGGRPGPVVKFKFSLANELLSMEFRRGVGRPEIFSQWPGNQQDRFGDLFRISQVPGGVHIGGAVTTDADRRLLLDVLDLLSTIVATGVQTVPVEPEKLRVWVGAARRLAAGARRVIEETASA